MTIYYVTSPQLPMVFTFHDCEKREVIDHMQQLMVGDVVPAADPADDAELAERGYFVRHKPGRDRMAVRKPEIESMDSDDEMMSFVIDWGQVGCVAITSVDPNPEADHWEKMLDDDAEQRKDAEGIAWIHGGLGSDANGS